MILKYIILKHKSTPIIFPSSSIKHKEIATNLGDVISAGFCIFFVKNNQIVVECYGKSSSLNIESNPQEDKKIIENFINKSQKNEELKTTSNTF